MKRPGFGAGLSPLLAVPGVGAANRVSDKGVIMLVFGDRARFGADNAWFGASAEWVCANDALSWSQCEFINSSAWVGAGVPGLGQ